MRRNDIRNIAIIAHVDHGKTTLVDCLLRQSGEFRASQLVGERILDSNELERERGITILAKNISIPYRGIKINVIDTPGHADFGGEVERVLRMADGALVLVDAAEGPMPQTRFVLSRPSNAACSRSWWSTRLIARSPGSRGAQRDLRALPPVGADEHLTDFPHIFSSSREGYATDAQTSVTIPCARCWTWCSSTFWTEIDPTRRSRLLVTTLDWSDYVGRIAIGRFLSGKIVQGQQVALMQAGGTTQSKVTGVFLFDKLGRTEVQEATAATRGRDCRAGNRVNRDTICDLESPRALPRWEVDPPTLEMVFGGNTSPLAGREGKYLTSRHVRARLARELEKNVAMRVTEEGPEAFRVAGRGLLHLSVLIETMRREGYELSIGKPRVILREQNGGLEEPFESLVVEVPPDRVGPVMELVGARRGQLSEMSTHDNYTYLVFSIPARGLIGLRTKLLNSTQGTAIMHHRFDRYRPMEGDVPSRPNGVLVSMVAGRVVAYALDGLQERADMFVAPGDEVYEGMVVGENSRTGDMSVNPTKEKN